MKLELKDLSIRYLDEYCKYIEEAQTTDPEEFGEEEINIVECAEATKSRFSDPMYKNVSCILAIIDNEVVGSIEYHYYGAFPTGMRMAYISCIHVLKKYRHFDVAAQLLKEAEQRMQSAGINEYCLIRSTKEISPSFYDDFTSDSCTSHTILKKSLCKDIT
ncbi:MAG: GNAT family N-acetyltransferase [Lachnospiraceae bacterium]|nr:GNAT family N-acetyltransferase [Lachnospiraceae bacterium]